MFGTSGQRPDRVGSGHHCLRLQGFFLKGSRHLRQDHPGEIIRQFHLHRYPLPQHRDQQFLMGRFRDSRRLRSHRDLHRFFLQGHRRPQDQHREHQSHHRRKPHFFPELFHPFPSSRLSYQEIGAESVDNWLAVPGITWYTDRDYMKKVIL